MRQTMLQRAEGEGVTPEVRRVLAAAERITELLQVQWKTEPDGRLTSHPDGWTLPTCERSGEALMELDAAVAAYAQSTGE